MNLRDSPDEAAFREQVRGWLAENLPAETGREWSRKMFDAIDLAIRIGSSVNDAAVVHHQSLYLQLLGLENRS